MRLTNRLVVRVLFSAVAFIVSAIVWQPWNADDASVIAPSIEGSLIEEFVPDDLDGDLDVLVQPATE